MPNQNQPTDIYNECVVNIFALRSSFLSRITQRSHCHSHATMRRIPYADGPSWTICHNHRTMHDGTMQFFLLISKFEYTRHLIFAHRFSIKYVNSLFAHATSMTCYNRESRSMPRPWSCKLVVPAECVNAWKWKEEQQWNLIREKWKTN